MIRLLFYKKRLFSHLISDRTQDFRPDIREKRRISRTGQEQSMEAMMLKYAVVFVRAVMCADRNSYDPEIRFVFRQPTVVSDP